MWRSMGIGLLVAVLTGCAAGKLRQGGEVVEMTVRDWPWRVSFPAGDYEVNIEDTSRPYFYFSSPSRKLNVSFNFDTTDRCNTAESCRDYLVARWRGAPGQPKKNWRLSTVGGVSVSENMDEPIAGVNLEMQHLNAHYVVDGVWVDVHLSKVAYRNADRTMFLDFVRSIKIEPKT